MEKRKGYLITNNKKECFGCTACKSICPQNAILMVSDEEGFFYPKVDKTKCINCHLCEKVCPINRQITKDRPSAYFYITNDEKDLLEASSGGAFGDIIASFYEEGNTIVYGCIFDENMKAVHVGYENKEDMIKFKKSKYVQSSLNNTFCEVEKNLKKGRKVLFSGTPCQVSGLKSFLDKEYDNLLCVDIICHGVPSQKLLDYYIKIQEKKYNSRMISINFREKVLEKNGHWNSRNIKMRFENNQSVIKTVKQCSYLFGFYNRLFYRPSCYSCNFSKIERDSDITIADCWGFEKINDNKYDVQKGISCIISNSLKGNDIIKNMTGIKDNLSIEFVINNNDSYTISTKLHKNRNKFFKDLNGNNFESKAFKYSQLSFYKRIIRKIKYLLK